MAQTVAAFERDPRVAWAEPNYLRRPALAVTDARFGELWGLENTRQPVNGVTGTPDKDIDLTSAWDITTGHPSVIVAVLDTGVALDHPDIAPNLWTNPGEIAGDGVDNDGNAIVDDVHGADWTGAVPDGDPTDLSAAAMHSHGTHVASTIAAPSGNGPGIAGVAPGVRVMPLRFLAPGVGDVVSEIQAIPYVRAKGARIVSGSFGGGPPSGAEEAAFAAASDVLFVFAAGNDGHNNDLTPTYPCSYPSPNIICVAATDQNDGLAGFSNFGPASVDLAAPGVNVLGGQAKFATVFSDDMDGGGSRWSTLGGWATTSASFASAPASLSDSPGGSYADSASSLNNFARVATPLNLTGRRGCGLFYDTRFALAAADSHDLESSVDGTNWTPEFSDLGSSAGDFLPTFIDFSHRDGAPALLFRFLITSRGVGVDDGAYVDNVRFSCLAVPASYSGAADEYAFLDGTSMATLASPAWRRSSFPWMPP